MLGGQRMLGLSYLLFLIITSMVVIRNATRTTHMPRISKQPPDSQNDVPEELQETAMDKIGSS